jgi:hypothetical protein
VASQSSTAPVGDYVSNQHTVLGNASRGGGLGV